MDYFLPPPVRNFFDSIFAAPIAFLNLAYDKLSHAALIAGHGINLNNYFGFFSYLPASWIAVVNSIIAGIVLLAVLSLVKSAIRLYFAIKDGVQWW